MSLRRALVVCDYPALPSGTSGTPCSYSFHGSHVPTPGAPPLLPPRRLRAPESGAVWGARPAGAKEGGGGGGGGGVVYAELLEAEGRMGLQHQVPGTS